MAEMKTLNTRIKLRIDTLENWNASEATLLPGELCFATVAATAGNGLTEPVIMAKIATEEGKKFSDLPWAFHAKASDVLAACKTEAGLKAFVNDVIADAGIASNDAMEALAGKVTTAEGKITTLEGKMTAVEDKASANEAAITALGKLVGDEAVATQISNAITELDLANKYEAKGEAAKVSTALETYKTTNDAKILEHTNAISANTNAITAIKDGENIDSFADVETALAGKEVSGAAAQALADAKAYANGLAGNYDAKGSAAAAQAAAEAYADGLAGNYDAAGSAADAQAAAVATAKKYTDDEIAEWVGDKTVAAQIKALDLANTYDAKGAAAAAETAAKGHADSLNTAMNTRVEALEAIDHDHINKTVLDGITAEKVAAWDAAEGNAKTHANNLNTAMDERVDALEAKFTGDDSVADQIADAVAAEAELRVNADNDLDARIDKLEGVVATDKPVSEYISDAVKAEADRAKGEEARIEGLVTTEAAKAREEEGKLDTRLVAVETFFKTTEGETLDTALDTLVEIQKYLDGEGEVADQMILDIAANKKAIEDHAALNHNFAAADATLKSELEGKIALKADKTTVEGIDGRLTTAEGKITTLEGEMDTAQADIATLERLVGTDKSVADQIAAVTDLLDERVEDLEAIDHDHSNKDVLDGIEAADITAWDAKVDAVTAAADSGLKATRTGNNIAIEIDDSITFIFDCGSSAE